jgi:hypothetical protein
LPTLIPTKFAYLYPLINDADCLPYLLAQYPPNPHPTVNSPSLHPVVYSPPSQQDRSSHAYTYFLPHSTLLSQLSKPNLFNEFLNSWALNQDNPSLHKPFPPFHLTFPISQAHSILVKPTYSQPAQPSYPKSKHKIATHTHSCFRPYPLTRPPLSLALPSHQFSRPIA